MAGRRGGRMGVVRNQVQSIWIPPRQSVVADEVLFLGLAYVQFAGRSELSLRLRQRLLTTAINEQSVLVSLTARRISADVILMPILMPAY